MTIEFTRSAYPEPDTVDTHAENEPGREDMFAWNFNLNEIDPELIFDESQPEETNHRPEQQAVDALNSPTEMQPTFVTWLRNTLPEAESDTEPRDQVPQAFAWAEQEAVKTSHRMAAVSLTGLTAVGSALGSLISIIGTCGPVCLHGLSSLAQASTSSLSAVPSLAGLGAPGFSIDRNGNFSLQGTIADLSQATGFTQDELRSGKVTAADIFKSFFSGFGEVFVALFGLGVVGSIVDALFDNFLPSPGDAIAG